MYFIMQNSRSLKEAFDYLTVRLLTLRGLLSFMWPSRKEQTDEKGNRKQLNCVEEYQELFLLYNKI